MDDALLFQRHLSGIPAFLQILKVTDNFFVLFLQQTAMYHVPFDPGILKCRISQLEGGEMVSDPSFSYVDFRTRDHTINSNGKLLSTTHHCATQSLEAEHAQHATISLQFLSQQFYDSHLSIVVIFPLVDNHSIIM
ncbi:hypothetical protein KP509_14G042700 [Ceratopteris richardii]|nr:hypothetical protein KP509_14G042700 [Ceratopteris richardii]